MSRFTGWTGEAVEAIQNKGCGAKPKIVRENKEERTAIKSINKKCPLSPLLNSLKFLGIYTETEYRFDPDRRWRFDLAIPQHKIGIEYEGGIWSQGRHTQGKGFARDIEKYNTAILKHGWTVIRYTVVQTHVKNWHWKEAMMIQALIKDRGKHDSRG